MHSFGRESERVLTQVAALVQNGEQHQTRTQAWIKLRLFVAVSEKTRLLQFAITPCINVIR